MKAFSRSTGSTHLTSEVDGGEWLFSDPSRFTPGEGTPVPTEKEAAWASEPVWTFWGKSNFLSVPEFSGQKMNTYDLDLLPE